MTQTLQSPAFLDFLNSMEFHGLPKKAFQCGGLPFDKDLTTVGVQRAQFCLSSSNLNMGRIFGSGCGVGMMIFCMIGGIVLFTVGMTLGIIGAAMYPSEKRWSDVRHGT
jgi:hypothetical protein